jgi:hypothetical protein
MTVLARVLDKNWPANELDGLVMKSMSGGGEGTILPVWHNVTAEQVRGYSLTLADSVALNTGQYSVEEIAAKIVSVVSE